MTALATFGIFFLVGFFLIIAAALTDMETPWPLTVFLFLALIVSGIIFGFGVVFATIWANLYWVIVASPIYLIAGGLWSVFKWDRYVVARFADYKKMQNEWFKAHSEAVARQTQLSQMAESSSDTGLTADLQRVTNELEVLKSREPQKEQFKPNWIDSLGKLSNWILFWPLSIVDYVLGDLLRDLIENIMNALGDWYQARTDKRFS